MVFYLSKSYEISMDEKKREEMKLLIVKLERYLAVRAKCLLEEMEAKFISGKGVRISKMERLGALSNYETCIAASEVSINILRIRGMENEAEEVENYVEKTQKRMRFICYKMNNSENEESRQLVRTQVQQLEKEIYERGGNANNLLEDFGAEAELWAKPTAELEQP